MQRSGGIQISRVANAGFEERDEIGACLGTRVGCSDSSGKAFGLADRRVRERKLARAERADPVMLLEAATDKRALGRPLDLGPAGREPPATRR